MTKAYSLEVGVGAGVGHATWRPELINVSIPSGSAIEVPNGVVYRPPSTGHAPINPARPTETVGYFDSQLTRPSIMETGDIRSFKTPCVGGEFEWHVSGKISRLERQDEAPFEFIQLKDFVFSCYRVATGNLVKRVTPFQEAIRQWDFSPTESSYFQHPLLDDFGDVQLTHSVETDLSNNLVALEDGTLMLHSLAFEDMDGSYLMAIMHPYRPTQARRVAGSATSSGWAGHWILSNGRRYTNPNLHWGWPIQLHILPYSYAASRVESRIFDLFDPLTSVVSRTITFNDLAGLPPTYQDDLMPYAGSKIIGPRFREFADGRWARDYDLHSDGTIYRRFWWDENGNRLSDETETLAAHPSFDCASVDVEAIGIEGVDLDEETDSDLIDAFDKDIPIFIFPGDMTDEEIDDYFESVIGDFPVADLAIMPHVVLQDCTDLVLSEEVVTNSATYAPGTLFADYLEGEIKRNVWLASGEFDGEFSAGDKVKLVADLLGETAIVKSGARFTADDGSAQQLYSDWPVKEILDTYGYESVFTRWANVPLVVKAGEPAFNPYIDEEGEDTVYIGKDINYWRPLILNGADIGGSKYVNQQVLELITGDLTDYETKLVDDRLFIKDDYGNWWPDYAYASNLADCFEADSDKDCSCQCKSLYQIWLDAGNEGSEHDFLASLRGQSAYELWLEDGNEGTLQDFFNSLKGESIQGDPGASAYEVWLTAGNEGSEQDFLESLKATPPAGKRTTDLPPADSIQGSEKLMLVQGGASKAATVAQLRDYLK